MMIQAAFGELEEYSPEKFVVKKVWEGAHSKVMVMHLLPGQDVPVHPHPDFEVVLVPQKGCAILTWEDGAETSVCAGSICCAGTSPVFGIENRGAEPFQMLVILARDTGGHVENDLR